jgi:hypothetical protein
MTTAFRTIPLAIAAMLLAPTALAETRTHDGFFLRGSLGYSFLSDGYRVESDSPLASADGNLTGHGPTFEALAGGTVKQGDLHVGPGVLMVGRNERQCGHPREMPALGRVVVIAHRLEQYAGLQSKAPLIGRPH